MKTGSIQIEKDLRLKEITTPKAVPGYCKIYPKSDDRYYYQDGSGVEHELTPDYYQTAFVNKNFADDELLHQFSTIQAAIDWAYAEYGDLGYLNHVMIFVYPGIYEEQIHSYQRYNLIGLMESTSQFEKNVTLYGDGDVPGNYPFRGNSGDVYDMSGFTIRTDVNGVAGNITNGSEFSKCVFSHGEFLDPVLNEGIYTKFDLCQFHNTNGFNFPAGARTGSRLIALYDCHFGNNKTPTFESTHTGNTSLSIHRTVMSFSPFSVKGDWRLIVDDITSFGTSRHVYGGNVAVQIINSTISNGIHFETAPTSFHYANNSCIDYADNPLAAGQADITADVDITCDSYVNNIQYNGLDGEILIPAVVKSVGGNRVNKYKDLVEAVKSVRGEEVINIFEDLTGLAEIVMPASGSVTIDGRRTFSLAFTGKVVTLGAGDKLVFNRLSEITGGTVELNGAAAEFHMHVCPCGDNTLEIKATAGVGSKVHLRNTNLAGDAGHSVIQANNTDTEYLVSFSRLIGATGQPAIEFTVEADDKLRARFSTFLHGDGGANVPIGNTSGEDVSYAMYSCGLNATLPPADFTNTIGSAGNVVDPQITF